MIMNALLIWFTHCKSTRTTDSTTFLPPLTYYYRLKNKDKQ